MKPELLWSLVPCVGPEPSEYKVDWKLPHPWPSGVGVEQVQAWASLRPDTSCVVLEQSLNLTTSLVLRIQLVVVYLTEEHVSPSTEWIWGWRTSCVAGCDVLCSFAMLTEV